MPEKLKIACLSFLVFTLLLISVGCKDMDESIDLPILMYHHFIDSGECKDNTEVSKERFEEQIAALKAAGYNTVSPQQLIEYVDNGEPLPKNPVFITMDDGYTSNVEIAAPILEKYRMCATVFIIGLTEGQTEYPHSGKPLDVPHMHYEDAADYIASGVLTIQSHTYDMHQRASHGFSGRDGVLALEGESEEAYTEALRADFGRSFQDIETALSEKPMALAYPYGLSSETSEKVLKEMGIKITLTTNYGVNHLSVGDPECLYKMNRCYVTDDMSGEDLIDLLESLKEPNI